MKALVRAKYEWELVNAKRLENLFCLVGEGLSFIAYLAWRASFGLAAGLLRASGRVATFSLGSRECARSVPLVQEQYLGIARNINPYL